MEQVHGSKIKQIYSIKNDSMTLKGVDGVFFMENFKNIAVGVRVADCMPVYIIWKESLAGVLHAGWQGVSKGIGEEIIKLINLRGLNKDEVYFFVGPHICKKCFKVKKEVKSKFRIDAVKGDRVSLFDALKIQLKEGGISSDNIKLIKKQGFCTYENGDYYSHRRGDPERMLAFAIQH